MKTCAYDELYLNDAMRSLSEAFDYAVNRCGMDCDDFSKRLAESTAGEQFCIGNPTYVSGRSGIELARLVMEGCRNGKFPDPVFSFEKSPEFWAGWVLAQYQWRSALSFKEIFSRVGMSAIVSMYPKYHEMDYTRFHETMNDKMGMTAELKKR